MTKRPKSAPSRECSIRYGCEEPFTSRQRAFLDEPWVCVPSTLDSTGAPHSASMWYVRDGEDLLIVTGQGPRKHYNLRRDDRVTVVVDRRQRLYYALMIQGRVEADAAEVVDVRSQLAERYLSTDEKIEFLKSPIETPSVVYRIVAEKISEYGALPAP